MSEFENITYVLRERCYLDRLLQDLAAWWEKAIAAGAPIVVTLTDDETRTVE